MNVDISERIQARSGRWLALAAIVLSALVQGLDTTILVTALPTLSAKLGGGGAQLVDIRRLHAGPGRLHASRRRAGRSPRPGAFAGGRRDRPARRRES